MHQRPGMKNLPVASMRASHLQQCESLSGVLESRDGLRVGLSFQ
jgi:hypothetical protein